MRISNKYILLLIFAIFATSCIHDDFEIVGDDRTPLESRSLISFVTERSGGIISLSIDAPVQDRFNVWIDLNNDGIRSGNGAEDITVFNKYQDYQISLGVNKVTLHGDITYLAAASNELITINISKNPFLKILNVPFNRLTSIDLSKNTALVNLDCSDNNINSIDLSHNKSLETLWVYNNQLTTLTVSDNTALTFLDCSGNQLKKLDLSNNSELVHLLCYNNQLSSLDISQNNMLNRIWAFDNPFSTNESVSLIGSLQKVSQGDLWISNELLSTEQLDILTKKGWEIN
mgnify:CR=1 FL=1